MIRHRLPIPCALALVALVASIPAQTCFEADFGAVIGYGTTDTVYPMQSIGFAFPFGGATYTHIHVNDHGFVQLSNNGVPTPFGSGFPQLFQPTTSHFGNGGPKIAPFYADIVLQGTGACFFRSAPTQCTVTWKGAQGYGVPLPRFDVQLQLLPTGVIRFVYGDGVTNNGNYGGVGQQAIVGVTAGNALLLNSRDISAGGVSDSVHTYEFFPLANSFDLAGQSITLTPWGSGFVITPQAIAGGPCALSERFGAGCDTLRLGSAGLPARGNPNYRLRAELVPSVSPLALFAFGTVANTAGIPLDGPLGMTGCSGYLTADIGIFAGSASVAGPAGMGQISEYPVPIPGSPALVGASFYAQALSFSLANAFGLAASEGHRIRVGLGGTPPPQPNPALQMVPIPPGTFQMGLAGVPASEPVHQVTLTYPFWMARHEVTQAQYQAVMGVNPSTWVAPQFPVYLISWLSARSYCAALTATEQAAGRVPVGFEYRLPTEAEWEYCCRAGTTTEWHTGTSLSTSQANFGGALANSTHTTGYLAVVGSYPPNAFGLQDMHGNLWEYCLDSFATYASGPVTDPFVTGSLGRVVRGGSYDVGNPANQCRSGARGNAHPAVNIYGNIGFRVVLAPILTP